MRSEGGRAYWNNPAMQGEYNEILTARPRRLQCQSTTDALACQRRPRRLLLPRRRRLCPPQPLHRRARRPREGRLCHCVSVAPWTFLLAL